MEFKAKIIDIKCSQLIFGRLISLIIKIIILSIVTFLGIGTVKIQNLIIDIIYLITQQGIIWLGIILGIIGIIIALFSLLDISDNDDVYFSNFLFKTLLKEKYNLT